jgi:hypothetical protein
MGLAQEVGCLRDGGSRGWRPLPDKSAHKSDSADLTSQRSPPTNQKELAFLKSFILQFKVI